MNFTYLIGALVTLAIWVVLYWSRRDLRKEMLVMGCFVAIMAVIWEAYFWTTDWWIPQTITGTRVGLEDILFGFALGGVTAVVYEEIFGKRSRSRANSFDALVLVIFTSAATHMTCFFLLGFSSFYSYIAGTLLPSLFMFAIRPDLFKDGVFTALMLTVYGFLGFALLNFFDPGFVQRWWLFEHLSGVVWLGVPVEDILWFFATGLFIGPIYGLWRVRAKRNLLKLKEKS